jgi:hypothetical protein
MSEEYPQTQPDPLDKTSDSSNPLDKTPISAESHGDAIEEFSSAASGRDSPVKRKRDMSSPVSEEDASKPTTKKIKFSSPDTKHTERAIYVFNRHQSTAQALGAKFRENTLTKFKYWYIPPDVCDLNRKILIQEFGKRKKDTPFPPVPSMSSSAQTPSRMFIEPSQMSPAFQTIMECNRTLMKQFNELTEKLSSNINK